MKCLKIDSGASSATIRFNLDELRILVQSVDYMADKHEVNLLSLSPDKEERERIAKYVKIKKNLSRISRSLL
ncbi:MAG: hypothetical protein WCE33_12425 [Nitrososphaeraceae archaeon]